MMVYDYDERLRTDWDIKIVLIPRFRTQERLVDDIIVMR